MKAARALRTTSMFSCDIARAVSREQVEAGLDPVAPSATGRVSAVWEVPLLPQAHGFEGLFAVGVHPSFESNPVRNVPDVEDGPLDPLIASAHGGFRQHRGQLERQVQRAARPRTRGRVARRCEEGSVGTTGLTPPI